MAEKITLKQRRLLSAKAQEYLVNLHHSAMEPYAAYGLLELRLSADSMELLSRSKRDRERALGELNCMLELLDLKMKLVKIKTVKNSWGVLVPLYRLEILDSDGETLDAINLPFFEELLIDASKRTDKNEIENIKKFMEDLK